MPGRPFDPLPDFIDPELATLVERAPEGDAWVHEIKLDGYRTGSRIERGNARMLTRHATIGPPDLNPCMLLAELPAKTAYLDGEIAVLTAEGVSDFGALQEALGGHGGSREMSFIAFDLVPGRPRPAAAAPDRTQGDPGEATGQAAGEEPGSNLRPCDHPVARVLRPCMQAAPGGHHLKAVN